MRAWLLWPAAGRSRDFLLPRLDAARTIDLSAGHGVCGRH